MSSNEVDGNLNLGLDERNLVEGLNKVVQNIDKSTERMNKAVSKFEKSLQDVNKMMSKLASSNSMNELGSKTEAALKKAEARAANLRLELEKLQQRTKTVEANRMGAALTEEERGRTVDKRAKRDVATIAAQAERERSAAEQRRLTNLRSEEQKRESAVLRSELSRRNVLFNQHVSEMKKGAREIDAALNKAYSAPPGTRERIEGLIGGDVNARRRDAMMGLAGMTHKEAVAAQLGEGFQADEAAFLAGLSGARPVGLGGRDIEGERNARRVAAEAKTKMRQGQREVQREYNEIQRILTRSLAAPVDVQKQIAQSLQGLGPAMQRRQAMAQGATLRQALQQNLAPVIGQQSATYLAHPGSGIRRPANIGGPPTRGGGGFWGQFGGAGQFARSAAAGLGIGAGGYAAVQGGRAVVEATQTATAYDRQAVAAENLAGSQAKLNALLDAYAEASGGAVDEVTELSNVTRLMATGFADSVEDTERFVRATRGASIALGKPQDYVIQETQLAISNVSQKRLDQIGLGISEVTERIAELREENAGWSRDTAFHEAVISLMDEKYGGLTDTVEGQATEVELLAKTWSDFMLQLGQDAQGPVSQMAKALRELLNRIKEAKEAIDEGIRTGEQPTENIGWEERLIIEGNRSVIGKPAGWAENESYLGRFGRGGVTVADNAADRQASGVNFHNAVQSFGNWVLRLPKDYGMINTPAPPIGAAGPLTGPRPSIIKPVPVDPMVAERNAVKNEGRLALERVERQANQARLNEIQNFETQRASIINSFGRQMVRSEEDFARQRARSQRDFEKSITKIGTDAVKREEKQARDLAKQEEEWQEDLEKNIEKAREGHEENVSKIQEKYNEDREKAEEKHRDNMIKAAGQLDAIAVLEERKRWKEENKERKEGYKDALEEQREALDKTIKEAQEAHQERIDDAREANQERIEEDRRADEERIREMREARAQQIADEDEDRRIQQDRAIEDHNAQLDELDRQHDLRMAQIEEQAEEETRVLEDALMKDLAALGVYIAGYQEMLDKQAEKTEDWFEGFIEMLEKRLEQERLANERAEQRTWHFDPALATEPRMVEYENGGLVRATGPAMLHGGEFVLSREMVANAMMGSTATSSSSKSIVFESGAIQIQTTPGYEELVGGIVEDRVVRLLESY